GRGEGALPCIQRSDFNACGDDQSPRVLVASDQAETPPCTLISPSPAVPLSPLRTHDYNANKNLTMISALTGELRAVEQDRLHLQVGPLLVEMLVPAADVPLLQAGVGQEMTFHTILYFEGDAAGGGGLEPRLVG